MGVSPDRKSSKNVHDDHRSRMRKKFIDHRESLYDHEILEMLLFYAVPRKNVNPLAHELIAKYGSLGSLAKAEIKSLLENDGVGESTAVFLSLIGEYIEKVNEEKHDKIKIYSLEQVKPFLIGALGGRKTEYFYIYYLGKKDKIIKKGFFTDGKTDSVSVCFDDLSKDLSIIRPESIVIAHNHPSGIIYPSLVDDASTKKIKEICDFFKVNFYDHIIVGDDDVYSYSKNGRMKTF
ncbi:MAG: RadC family protein [Clostridia bacterium]|nr:RadC family protein [Clostridia bacterium]